MNLDPNAPILIAKNSIINEQLSKLAKYNVKTKTLTVLVNGFSTYTYVPTITVTSAHTINTQAYTLTGTISDKDSTIDIIVNGNLIAQNVKTNEQGYFSYNLQLTEGENTITIQDSHIKLAKITQTVKVQIQRNIVQKLGLQIRDLVNTIMNNIKKLLANL